MKRLTIEEAFVVAVKVIFLFSGNKPDRDGILAGVYIGFLVGSESGHLRQRQHRVVARG